MNVNSHADIYQYQETRGLERFPSTTLDHLFKMNEYFENLREPFGTYLTRLSEAGVENKVCTLVAHALVSILIHHEEKGKQHLAQFLVPPVINPYSEPYPNDPDSLTLIARWERDNIEKSQPIIQEISNKIFQYQQSKNEQEIPKAETFISQGSMFSEKTRRLLAVIEDLYNKGWKGKVEALLAESMEEDFIMSREGARENSPLEIVRRIWIQPENRVTANSILDRLQSINLNAGDLIAIDEISFIAFTPEENAAILDAVREVNRKGIFVYMVGLNSDLHAQDLPFTQELKENGTFKVDDCNGYYAFYADNIVHSGNHKTLTSRIDKIGTFSDFVLPVVVSRVHSRLVQYVPVPSEAHPFEVLRQCDPEVHALLLSNPQQGLYDYYQEISAVET